MIHLSIVCMVCNTLQRVSRAVSKLEAFQTRLAPGDGGYHSCYSTAFGQRFFRSKATMWWNGLTRSLFDRNFSRTLFNHLFDLHSV